MITIFAVAEETGLKNSGLNETRTQTSAMQTWTDGALHRHRRGQSPVQSFISLLLKDGTH